MLLGNLFRDQLDRYGELETIADRWAAVVAARPAARRSCSTPTTRWSPTSAATPRAASTSASTTTRSRCPSSSTRRTPSTAAAAGTPTPTSAVYLAHLGHYRCPNCGQERPTPDGRGHATSSCAASAAPPSRCDGARAVELPLPGLYNVYNALGAAALSLSARRRARRRRRRPGGRRARVRPRRDARPRRPPDLDPAGQEPGRRQRGAAHARARGRASSTCSACSTTAPPTAATSRWVWDADWELLVGRVRAHDLLAARAPPSSRCG